LVPPLPALSLYCLLAFAHQIILSASRDSLAMLLPTAPLLLPPLTNAARDMAPQHKPPISFEDKVRSLIYHDYPDLYTHPHPQEHYPQPQQFYQPHHNNWNSPNPHQWDEYP